MCTLSQKPERQSDPGQGKFIFCFMFEISSSALVTIYLPVQYHIPKRYILLRRRDLDSPGPEQRYTGVCCAAFIMIVYYFRPWQCAVAKNH